MRTTSVADVRKQLPKVAEPRVEYGDSLSREELIERLNREMQAAAANLEFERAAILRDEIKRLKSQRQNV